MNTNRLSTFRRLYGKRPAAIAVLLAVFVTVFAAMPEARFVALAENPPFPCSLVTDPNNDPSTDPRVDHLVVAGVKVTVLLPPRYHAEHHRYPVVYLFHGAFGDQDSFTSQTDLIAFTARMPDRDQSIVVM